MIRLPGECGGLSDGQSTPAERGALTRPVLCAHPGLCPPPSALSCAPTPAQAPPSAQAPTPAQGPCFGQAFGLARSAPPARTARRGHDERRASNPSHPAPARLLGVTGRTRADLLRGTALQATTVLVLSLPFWTATAAAQPAPNAMPAGGSVVAGSATISQTSNTTAITQTTQRAAIDWRSFNVGSQQQVTFAQPSSGAVALNRVTGPDPSQIAGKITANGQVVLVNQAGVTFYKGAQVNAQSLIVSSANITNGAFMAGNMAFDQAGNPNARVVNQGVITVKQAGLAALVAPSVANSGVINARLGHVVLAGVKTATLDLYGDGLLALDVSNQVTKAPVGPDGKPVAALVTNTGVIRANGGTVQLTAMAADGVVGNLVQAGGKIVANSTAARTGSVTVAGIGGSVTVTGLLSVAGKATGTTGGTVAVNTTGAVTLASKARINASGVAGGGTVAIGTTLQRATGGPGTPAALTAASVAVNKGASINASAGKTGNGGRVTVLSTGTTQMDGAITATGGGLTGNGGFVEVSGATLGLTGTVVVSAPNGLTGTLLLDPTDLAIIGNAPEGGSSVDFEVVNGTLLASAPDGDPLPSTVFASTLQNMSGAANIVVQATGTIDVRAPLTVFNGLTLLAGGNLTVESGAPLQATGNILLRAGTATPSGALVINDSVTSAITGGQVQLFSGTGGITLNGNISAFTVDLNTTGGGVTQTGGSIAVTSELLSSTGVTGTVSLLDANSVPNLAGFTVTGGDFQLVDTFPLNVSGHVTANNVFLQEGDTDGITIANFGAVIAPGGLASIRADALGIAAGQGPTPSGSITADTFEFAPDSPKFSMSIGLGAVNGVVLNSLNNITSTGVKIGNVTAPAALGVASATATITVAGSFDALNRALELDTRGPVDGTAGTLINVGTLSGTGAAWSLPLANTVTNLGNISAGDFELNDGVPLTVAGALVSAAGATITDTGLLTVDGTVSGAAVNLAADSMAIPGVVTDGGAGTVQLTANTGTIGETGTLIAAVLTGSAAGAVDLLGASASANAVATLGTSLPPPSTGEFSAASFALRDGIGLTVAGTVVATAGGGQVFLASTAPAGITILATGAVLADTSTGTASLQTDALLNNGTVAAAAIELAPATAGGTVTLGSSGAGLSLLSMSGLSATDLTVGAVTQPGGTSPTTTAGGVMIGGAFTFTGTGSLVLDAASSTAPGADGVVRQTAALTDAAQLSGSADTFALTSSGNAISTLVDMTASTGEIAVISGTALAAAGLSAPAGSVFLSSSSGGVSIEGPVSANQRVSVQADDFTLEGGSVSAATFELAPETSGATVSLGAGTGGLLVSSLTGLSVTTARLGAVTGPGAATPTTRAGAVTIGAPFDASAAATLELDATGAITQTAALTGGTLAAVAGSVVLGNTGNRIGSSSGIIATNGNIVLVNGESLALNGSYSGNDLFFEVAAAGGTLTLGGTGPATLSPAAGGRISLVADGLSANTTGSIGTAGGTVELAPFSSVGVSLAGTGTGTTFTAALLSNINVGTGTLVIGGYTNLPAGGTGLIPTAGSISLDGAVDLTGRAGTLVLLASGPVTEPGGPLTVGTVTGVSTGDFTLDNPANLIQIGGGIIANNGNVVLETDPTMLLTGTYTGNNLFFEVSQAGGSLAVGNTIAAATLLVPTGGRISLVADTISANSLSKITAQSGTLEIAPFSATAESIQGAALGEVTNGLGTLVVGGYTNPRTPLNGPSASAGSVVLDGPLDLTSLAANLRLLSLGPVTEPGGPLTVANVFGTSGGTFALTNPTNAIGQSTGIVAANGDVVVVNGGNLTLTGAYGGNNLFFEVATQGGTLTLGNAGGEVPTPATLTAATGGRISLVADQVTATAGDALTAPGGTVELAPFSSLAISLPGSAIAGQFAIDTTLLTSLTPGVGTLTVGGFTNVPAGGTVAVPSAASVTIGGSVSLGSLAATLNLEAVGAITQTAPLTGVGTLAATGSSVILANAGNQIGAGSGITATAGDVVLVDGTSLALNGTYSGNDLFFEVATKGGALTIGGVAPATLSLTGSAVAGASISLVADGLSANTTGSIGNAGGTVELAPFSPIAVSLAGSGGAGMTISEALLANINVGAGTLVVGGYTPPGAGSTTSAGAITLDGPVNLSGRAGTLDLLANGAITEPGGPLNVATVTGVAGSGDFSLSDPANQIQVSTGMTANNGNVVLVDGTSLQLVGGGIPVGPFTGQNLFFEVEQPGGTLAINGVLTATVGRASLVADTITAASQSLILAPGSVELAPFSAIDVSLGGSSAPGTLGLGATLLSNFVIRGGIKGEELANDLVIGGYTNLPAGASTVRTSAANITVDAPVNVHGALTLDLLSNGSVSEPNGSIIATNIQGSAGTSFALTNPGNEIDRSLGITAAKGDVVLVDATDLTLAGAHGGDNLFFEVARQGGILQIGTSDAAASLTAASGGRITLVADQMTATGSSTLSAPAGTLELAPFSAVNLSLAGSSASGQALIDPSVPPIVTPGLSTLTVGGYTNVPAGATTSMASAASISVDGPVTIGPVANVLNFEATGAVTQSAPITTVGTLTGTTGSTTLTNAGNSVAVLGDYTASNGFALTDSTGLSIAGPLAAGPAANVTVNGVLTESGGITAGQLSGGAAGTATLTGANNIGELNGFTVGGGASSLVFIPGGDLLIAGTVSANRIVISAPANQITLASGTNIVTGGAARPTGTAPPASLLPANGGPGALLQSAGFTQLGRATVSSLGGGPSTLQVSVTGNIRFDGALGLSATGTWLILTLTDGSATGDVYVKALDVSYTPGGSANLFGTVQGVAGVAAAGLGFIQPTLNVRYTFNNCEIGSAACLLATRSTRFFPSETAMFVPVDALLALVTPALILDPQDNDDLLELPVVSRKDY